MQSVIQLEDDIGTANTRIRELERALQTSKSFEDTLKHQTDLDSVRRVLERYQNQLSEARQREAEDLAGRKREEALQEIVDLKSGLWDALHAREFLVSELVEDLRPKIERYGELNDQAQRLADECQYLSQLFNKTYDYWPDSANKYTSTKPESRDDLFRLIEFMLPLAVNTVRRLGDGYSMLMAIINGAYIPRENTQPTPTPNTTPTPIDESKLTPGQLMALHRRPRSRDNS